MIGIHFTLPKEEIAVSLIRVIIIELDAAFSRKPSLSYPYELISGH